jgi:hypothetical protein
MVRFIYFYSHYDNGEKNYPILKLVKNNVKKYKNQIIYIEKWEIYLVVRKHIN